MYYSCIIYSFYSFLKFNPRKDTFVQTDYITKNLLYKNNYIKLYENYCNCPVCPSRKDQLLNTKNMQLRFDAVYDRGKRLQSDCIFILDSMHICIPFILKYGYGT